MPNKNEIMEIPINKIRPARWQPRETFTKESIEELGQSMKEKGIIQPIIVRPNDDGYQLIAGERRWRAWEMTGKKTIPAIVKDVDDFEAKEISIIENWQRENLTNVEAQKFIYQLWRDGVANNKYNSIEDLSKKTGISRSILNVIINAGKETESDGAHQILKSSSAEDLQRTRILKDDADIREILLEKRLTSPDTFTQKDVRTTAHAIVEAPPETRKEIAKLISEEKIEPKQVEAFVKTLKDAPKDVQQKMLRQEITPEEAEEVKFFKLPEQREQVLREKQIIKEEQKKEQDAHTKIRREQAKALEEGKSGEIIFDTKEADFDERMTQRYRDFHLKAVGFRSDHIRQIVNDRYRRECINWVRRTYEHCQKILIDLGEIKQI